MESVQSRNDIVTEQPTKWHEVNWPKAHKAVEKLRRRIYRATQEGDWKKVKNLPFADAQESFQQTYIRQTGNPAE